MTHQLKQEIIFPKNRGTLKTHGTPLQVLRNPVEERWYTCNAWHT